MYKSLTTEIAEAWVEKTNGDPVWVARLTAFRAADEIRDHGYVADVCNTLTTQAQHPVPPVKPQYGPRSTNRRPGKPVNPEY